MTDAISHKPLNLPTCLGERIGHYALIAMMLPILMPVAIFGFIFGTYRRALKHAADARKQAEYSANA